jgi:hypothetical protein
MPGQDSGSRYGARIRSSRYRADAWYFIKQILREAIRVVASDEFQ